MELFLGRVTRKSYEMHYANQIGPLERNSARRAILDQIGRSVDHGGAADYWQQLPPYVDLSLDDDE